MSVNGVNIWREDPAQFCCATDTEIWLTQQHGTLTVNSMEWKPNATELTFTLGEWGNMNKNNTIQYNTIQYRADRLWIDVHGHAPTRWMRLKRWSGLYELESSINETQFQPELISIWIWWFTLRSTKRLNLFIYFVFFFFFFHLFSCSFGSFVRSVLLFLFGFGFILFCCCFRHWFLSSHSIAHRLSVVYRCVCAHV